MHAKNKIKKSSIISIYKMQTVTLNRGIRTNKNTAAKTHLGIHVSDDIKNGRDRRFFSFVCLFVFTVAFIGQEKKKRYILCLL